MLGEKGVNEGQKTACFTVFWYKTGFRSRIFKIKTTSKPIKNYETRQNPHMSEPWYNT